MKQLSFIIATACAMLGMTPAMALAAFGFQGVDVTFTEADGSPATQAGSHPFALTTTLRMNTVEEAGLEAPDGDLKDLRIDYPPGIAAALTAVPSCSSEDFLQVEGDKNACSDSTAIGIGEVTASTSGPIPAGSEDFLHTVPVYNLTASPGTIARVGFVVDELPVTFALGLSDVPPYNGFAVLSSLTQAALFFSARVSIWGVPASPAHDADRGQCAFSTGNCPAGISQRPFLTAPRSCTGPLATGFEADSWQDPGQWFGAVAFSHDNAKPPNPQGQSGCGKLAFAPKVAAQPTTDLAATPSGLDLSIDVVDEGFVNPGGIAQSDVKELVLTLPEGMVSNPAAVKGLASCTPAQFGQETLEPEPGQGCPQGSEIGTIEVESPLLEGEVLGGQVFTGKPEVPFHRPLYIVVRRSQLGVFAKLVGDIETDPLSGQLTIAFDGLPQLPLSHVGVRLHDGDAGPLLTPPECDEFTTKAALAPWSEPGVLYGITTSFEIDAGPGGGPCPEEEGEKPPLVGSGNSPAGASTPPALPAAVTIAPRKRPCPRGRHRVVRRGKARCVKRHRHVRHRHSFALSG
jgi:hypothetical protein